MNTVSPAARHTTTGAVVVVAGIAAVVSYAHMQQLADHAGESWRSWLIPVSIDGLIVAASMVLLTRHRAGLPGGWLAWGSLGVGVVASLAANMADARPEVTSVLVAGWAPVAFAATFHLLLQQRRADRATPLTSGPDRSEPSSGAFGAVGPDLTGNAPLDYSGGPAERAATVLPGRDGSDVPESPSRPGPTLPVRPTSPGPDGLPAGRLVTGPLPSPPRTVRLFRSCGPGRVDPPGRPGSGPRSASGQVPRAGRRQVLRAGPMSSSCRPPVSWRAGLTGR